MSAILADPGKTVETISTTNPKEIDKMTVHKLKLLPDYFDAVVNGIKTFEIRKYDRDYKVGDTLHLYEFDPEEEEFRAKTRTCDVAVTYILTHEDFPDGIPEDYCVMGIRRQCE